MVGSTWPRVCLTLESECLPALSQGTASFRLAYGLTAFVATARIRCLVIGVVLVRLSSALCPPFVYAALGAILLPVIKSADMVLRIP